MMLYEIIIKAIGLMVLDKSFEHCIFKMQPTDTVRKYHSGIIPFKIGRGRTKTSAICAQLR